ncbi:carbohydrate-binding family 9-like protein [uncultured Mucilaginibacter sp.]|uniref:carbohydrate-binding family 9-like protein n=1 Tax=uncultured Mucilaginibacter sp. TaxID=797541 RepID=UPI0025EF6414|nr:carbohydrate-binding family 9-like protein [uncultured Mucilaginibacter sp.]
MISIQIPFLLQAPDDDRQLTFHRILNEPWKSGATSCSAEFRIAHLNDALLLKFKVKEPFLKAKKRKNNDAVHLDNCVEFFLAFPGDESYYNFEFNCLGAVKAAYGKGRNYRKYLADEVLNRISNNLSLSINNLYDDRKICWELSVILNMDMFSFHQYSSFAGLKCTGNFTKCGEKLPQPHFLTWSDSLAEKPDFHRIEFFGKIDFSPLPVGFQSNKNITLLNPQAKLHET